MRGQGGTGTVPVFTDRSLVEGGARLYPRGIATANPQHFTVASGRASTNPTRSSPVITPSVMLGCAPQPAQIRQVRAGGPLGGFTHRFLAYTSSSRSPDPHHPRHRSGRFFTTLTEYLQTERRPLESSRDAVFLVLKGPNCGAPLSAAGLDQILKGAKSRAGLSRLTCHMLRHTCLTRLREAGMALEAVQAQAGHRSIESTRIYLHLSNGWLAEEYDRAISALEHDLDETSCTESIEAAR
jgi:Phage integrase family